MADQISRTTTPLALPLTRAALAEFDAGAAARERAWQAAQSDEAVQLAQRAEQAAVEKVQDAFYEDTKDFNSRSARRCVEISYIRQLLTRGA